MTDPKDTENQNTGDQDTGDKSADAHDADHTTHASTPDSEAPENGGSTTQQAPFTSEPEPDVYPSGIWMRALHMVIFMILFGVAETLLFFMAVFQFLWMLFTRKRNPSVAQFGDQVSQWLRDVGRFQSGATDDKPFPWSDAS